MRNEISSNFFYCTQKNSDNSRFIEDILNILFYKLCIVVISIKSWIILDFRCKIETLVLVYVLNFFQSIIIVIRVKNLNANQKSNKM